MAQGFANSSILAYYMFDEVGPKSLALDKAVTQAVTGNDTNHPTFSLVCGVQCSGWFDGLNARRYAEQHSVVAVDSCERASCRQAWPSCSDHRNNSCFLTKSCCYLNDLACFVCRYGISAHGAGQPNFHRAGRRECQGLEPTWTASAGCSAGCFHLRDGVYPDQSTPYCWL